MSTDYLLPIGQVPSNKNYQVKEMAQIHATKQAIKHQSKQADKKIFEVNQMHIPQTAKATKNVSFSKNVQVKNFNKGENEKMEGDDPAVHNPFTNLNESSIGNIPQGYNHSFESNAMGDFNTDKIKELNLSKQDLDNKSEMWGSILGFQNGISRNIQIDERIQEDLFGNQLESSKHMPEIQDLDTFKAHLNSKYEPNVILEMYRKIVEQQFGNSQESLQEFRSENNQSNEQQVTLDDQFVCGICLSGTDADERVDNELDKLKFCSSTCWHSQHQVCIVHHVKSKTLEFAKCPECNGAYTSDDIKFMDDFITTRYGARDMKDWIDSN